MPLAILARSPDSLRLTAQVQRFCPICNRAFGDGEAVLRCEGCGVLHHPGCWVKQGGCATDGEHDMTPVALAYAQQPAPQPIVLHPGEGVRVKTRRAPPRLALPPGDDTETVIGAANPPPRPPVHHTQPLPLTVQPPTPPRRYGATAGVAAGPRTMPSIYNRHGLLAFWYVPVAAALAVAVALGVIWVFAQLGDGDEATPAAPTTAAGTQAASTPGAAPARGVGSPTAATSGTPLATGKFRVGEAAVVTGTGDCLNVRVAAGRANDAIVCLRDGETVTVTGGPTLIDGLTWWKVKTAIGEGWAAEDYLSKRP